VRSELDIIDVDEASFVTSPSSSPTLTEPPSSDAPGPAPAVRPPAVKKPTIKKSTLAMPVPRKKGKGGNGKKLTVSEWARRLQPAMFPPPPGEDPEPTVVPSWKRPLKGATVFYFGGEMVGYMGEATKNRLRHVGHFATCLQHVSLRYASPAHQLRRHCTARL
jgi:hypothetical protein